MAIARWIPIAVLLAALGSPERVRAEEPSPAGEAHPRYAWPFLGRPLEPTSYVRLDTTLGTYREESTSGPHGYALAQLFSFGVAVADSLVPFARGGWAFSHDRMDREGTMFGNLELGVIALARLGQEVRLAGHLSVYLPTGSAQGTDAPEHERRARQEGQRTRLGIGAPVLLTNDFGIAASSSLAWVWDGITAQLELGFEPVIRVSGGGDDAALAAYGTVHFGWFPIRELSLAVELTHHQWVAGRPNGGSPGAITAVSVGARAHARIGNAALRPGIAYAHALGGELEREEYHVLQVDLVLDL